MADWGVFNKSYPKKDKSVTDKGIPETPDYLAQSEVLEKPFIDPTDPSSWPISPSALAKLGAAKLGGLAALGVIKNKGDDVHKLLQGMYRGRGSSMMPVDNEGKVFMSPQRKYAEYYANKRVAENPAERGEAVVDMFLVDPFNTPRQGHSVPTNRFNDFEHIYSRIAKPNVKDVGDPISTSLVPEERVRKAQGGTVQMKPTPNWPF